MLSNQNQSFGKQNIQDFNLKKTLSLYSKQWKWFLLSVMIGLGVAYIYLRYTTPVYEASAKIMLLDENESSTTSVFNEMGFYEGEQAKIEDEIQVENMNQYDEEMVPAPIMDDGIGSQSQLELIDGDLWDSAGGNSTYSSYMRDFKNGL